MMRTKHVEKVTLTLSAKLACAIAAALALIMLPLAAQSQSIPDAETALTAPLEPLHTAIDADQLFADLEAHNSLRKAALLDYTVQRTYLVLDLKGKVHAEESGRMEFNAPDQKKFVTTSESGSGLVRRMALNPLISSEISAASGKEHHDSAISPANYALVVIGEQQVGPYHCLVAQASPRRKDKYLFEGRLWIDSKDYAVVRIEGHPAKKLSFWIERADFIRQYQKVDGFWLPEKDQTFVQVRLYGKKVLSIEHRNYVVNATLPKAAPSPTLDSRALALARELSSSDK